jgi:pimeloyl-ACP methyl ester carboxylesterase
MSLFDHADKKEFPMVKRALFLLLLLCGLFVSLGETAVATPASPTTPTACTTNTRPNGEIYQICMPLLIQNWNHDLIVYAHGYVPAWEPLALPSEASLIALAVNAQNYAFATTSYRSNGLAVLEAIEDLQLLVADFRALHPELENVLLMGFSEGGLVTTLSVEQFPDIYAGGLAACGPIGSFQGQIDYIANFRLIFDYFFPGLMPGSAIELPQAFLDGLRDGDFTWDEFFDDTIAPVVNAPENAGKVAQLILITQAPSDLTNATTTISEALRYNVIATNDAREKLGGVPFDNTETLYVGSDDDDTLNATIPRYSADPDARAAVVAYETNGVLSRPLVTMHTIYDAVVPFWHDVLYLGKVYAADNIAQHDRIVVERYGHCAFETQEVQQAVNLLADRIANPPPYQPVRQLYLPVVGDWGFETGD